MIKVYSKEGCPYCDQAKSFLAGRGFEYSEIRIDKDPDARDFVLGEGHKTVPQVYIEDQLLVEGGFDGLSLMTTKQIQQRINEVNGY